MDKKDWEKAKERLMLPFGRVKLIADGYAVTLQKVPVKDMFHNAIAVFINGEFHIPHFTNREYHCRCNDTHDFLWGARWKECSLTQGPGGWQCCCSAA